MSLNPPSLRPDIAPTLRLDDAQARAAAGRGAQPTIGMVSLGCPKALVDSERILTRLRAEGYAISPQYQGADAVIVNTCGFLDSAKAESLEAIGEALSENGRVIVTGCLGAEPEYITGVHPRVLAVTGPHQYEQVLDAVHLAVPPAPDPFIDLLPASEVRLTPRHYAYLKISEGCNHACKFCIIPDMRGRLVSRPAHAVVREAEKLVASGVRELLVISQDTSAYGLDLRHAEERGHRAHITDLARDLGSLGAWVRLHYVYPYPHVRNLIPLMAETAATGTGVLPYLDIPFQHAHPDVLRRMARPAASARTLDEIAAWRAAAPGITLRSTFIVGYPGETEAEFQYLLDWLDEAQLDRVGCFQYENVKGARANDLPDHVPDEVKQDRWDRFMQKAQAISAAKLAAKVGTRQAVIVDSIDADGATCRTMADAPEIDGNLFIDEGFEALTPGDIVTVTVDEASDYDLWGDAVTDLPKWDPEGAPKKPQIVGIGAQKAGTTWLGQMISQHPQVWLPPFKEAQFFNHRFVPEHRQWLPWHFKRARENQEKRYTAKGEPMPPSLEAYLDRITRGEMFTNHWYKQVFAPAPEGTIPCDITPEYSTLPDEGVEFVTDFLPKARFIYIIRHPVDRAISQLKMNLTRKKKNPRGVEAWLAEIDDPVLYDRGDYATYVARWTSRVPQDRLLILPFGLIAKDPAGFMRKVEDFCGLAPHEYRGLKAKVFAANSALSVPPEARAKIRERLEPQFEFIEQNFGKEFSSHIR